MGCGDNVASGGIFTQDPNQSWASAEPPTFPIYQFWEPGGARAGGTLNSQEFKFNPGNCEMNTA